MNNNFSNRCNSFDVFDTLLGRKYFFPETIFYLVERKSGFKNFVKYRKEAEKLVEEGDFIAIYQQFQKLTHCSDLQLRKLKGLELFLELKNLIPITENASKVNENDIVISDMYLSRAIIHYFLKKNSIHLPLDNVFVSRQGKAKGWIYKEISREYNIKCHYGDNNHADLLMAKKNNIYAKLTREFLFSVTERLISNEGFISLALLSRSVRLVNQEHSVTAKKIWNDTASVTIPVLILMCMEIKKASQSKNYKYILFSQRDCCHLLKLYKALYPECKKAKVLFISRECLYNSSDAFIDYARKTMQDSLVVDLAISGRSMVTFVEKTNIKFDVFSLIVLKEYFMFSKNKRRSLPCDYMINHYIHGKLACQERLNLELYGSICDFDGSRPVRNSIEYSRSYVRPAHNAVDKAVEFIKKENFFIEDKFSRKESSNLSILLARYSYCYPCEVHLNNHIENSVSRNSNYMSSYNLRNIKVIFYRFYCSTIVKYRHILALERISLYNLRLARKRKYLKRMFRKDKKIINMIIKSSAS